MYIVYKYNQVAAGYEYVYLPRFTDGAPPVAWAAATAWALRASSDALKASTGTAAAVA